VTRSLGWILAVALFTVLVLGIRDYVIDDTYIHLQYAKHVREGHGLVFNIGDPVPGTTSPLWSLLLGWIPTLGLDLVFLSKLLSGLAGLATLLLFLRAASGFMVHRSTAVAATVAWAANAWMVRWTPSGMETSLAVFLVLLGWMVGRGSDEEPAGVRRRIAVGFIWGLAALARPEAGILVFLYTIISGLWPAGLSGRPGLGARFGALLAPAAGAAAALIPFFIYSYFLYGTPLPGTLAAKAAGGMSFAVASSQLMQSAKIVGAVCTIEALAILLLLPRITSAFRRGDAVLHLASWAWLLLVPIGYAVRGVPVISRYLLPLLPLIVLYAWFLLEQWKFSRPTMLRRAVLVAVLIISVSLNLVVYSYRVVPHTRQFTAGMERTLIPWGKWLGENTDPDILVATPDIGAIGYFSGRRVLDLGGLVSPDIVPLMQRMPYDDLVRTFAFRAAGHPHYLVDRGYGPARLIDESPYGEALRPIFMERTESLAMAKPGAVDYTLYRIDWRAVDALEAQTDVASAASQ
jgi:hypothetical protein